MPQLENRRVGLLLGAYTLLAMEPLEVIPSRAGSPYAVRTRYGWTLGGLRSGPQPSTSAKVCRTSVKTDQDLESMIKQMYNSEYEENLNSTKKGASVEDREWPTKVEESIYSEEGHYVISLPLTEDKLNLPNNIGMAKGRLEGLKKKEVQEKREVRRRVQEQHEGDGRPGICGASTTGRFATR